MEYLVALLGLLAGALLYTRTKQKSAEAINENVETKEKLLEVEKNSLKDKAKLAVEKEKTDNLEKKLKEPEVTNENLNDLLDFFDKFTKK